MEQLLQLRELGCKYVQGYLFSKPVDAETVEWLHLNNCEADILFTSPDRNQDQKLRLAIGIGGRQIPIVV
jgi:predicted signal transduction protein with EAL and GGDEF domain